MRRGLIRISFPLIVLVVLSAYDTQAKERITWTYFSFPPFFIVEDDGGISGISHDIQELLWQNLPQYEHERLYSPVQRSLADVIHGGNYCLTGLLKTPEREKDLVYSLPCRLVMPIMVVIRKEDMARFGNGGPVSLDALLSDTSLTMGRVRGFSHGPVLDAILKSHEETMSVFHIYTPETIARQLQLLMAHRVDYLLQVAIQTHYQAEMAGIQDDIVLLPVEEAMGYRVGHIACTRNEWGESVIEAINSILRREIPTERFFDIFAPYVDDKNLPEFRKQYQELLVKPCQ